MNTLKGFPKKALLLKFRFLQRVFKTGYSALRIFVNTVIYLVQILI